MSKIFTNWHRAVLGLSVVALGVFGWVILSQRGGGADQPVAVSLKRAKALCVACRQYALDHGGEFPPSLDALFPKYLSDRQALVSPLNPAEPVGYVYTTGLKAPVRVDTVVIEDKFAPQQHERIVSYADDSARVLNGP